MEIGLLLKSMLIGLAIAAPVGPMAVLCVNRVLNQGVASGVSTGFGIATADAMFGCIAGFGLSVISGFLISHQLYIRWIGGVLLILMGVKLLLKAKPIDILSAKSRGKNHLGNYFYAIVLTLTNPITLMAVIAIFAGLGIGSTYTDYYHAVIVIIGMFCGSLIWWLALTLFVRMMHHRISPQAMLWINRFSGVIITIFGILALVV